MKYPEHDPSKLEPHYCEHVSAMTSEGLHAKSDIAIQLAWRDAEIERLTAILLHVNNSLAGADQDTEHQIDSHADTLPHYTRSLALAIEVAHGPVNEWLQARVWKESPPPLLACADDCRCLEQAEEVRRLPPLDEVPKVIT
jgi:hypothetical protein